MVLFLTIFTSLLLIGCITLAYQLWKLSNNLLSRARLYADNLYQSHKKTKIELKKRSDELDIKEKNIDKQYNKLKDNLSKKQEELENKFKAKRLALESEYEQKQIDNEQEINEALKEAEEAIEESLSRVDNILEERLAEITAKNTKMFNCLCNDKPIACYIDLSDENTYRCPECGTVYSVEITMNPTIIGKAISDEDYVALIKTRLENE